MKHLRKYNEDVDEVDFDHIQQSYKKWEENGRLLKIKEDNDKVIKDYIKDCFIEFYDKFGEGEDGVFVEDFSDIDVFSIEMTIDEPKDIFKKRNLRNYYKNSNDSDYLQLDDIIEHGKDIVEFYEEIKYCIEKVKINYKYMDIKFEREQDADDDSYITIKFKK